jgi:SAM-dependent methyltransferase
MSTLGTDLFMEDARQRSVLRELYLARRLDPPTYSDEAEYSYLNNHLIERSIALLAHEITGVVLEVGCGEQPYKPYFSNVEKIIATDFNPARGVFDVVAPACPLPFRDQAFDGIIATEVLEHVPDPAATFCEFYRVLKPGGKVILSTPMYWPAHEQPYDFFRYPGHGLLALASRAGFEVKALCPRGGIYILMGQVILMAIQQYFRNAMVRRYWNRAMLYFDRSRTNPRLTLGWTLLVTKPSNWRRFELSPRER